MIETRQITGLLLAGGRGSRMGGVDKGLQLLDGRPLAAHVLERLLPQVGALIINANRNGDDYRARFGLPVVADADASFAGPLAGLLAGLLAADTEWLLSAPCDAPRLPQDLAPRLAAALIEQGADLAVPVDAEGQLQPVHCLLRCRLAPALAEFLAGGGRKVEAWLATQNHCRVLFNRPDDAQAFVNANSLTDLHRLERHA